MKVRYIYSACLEIETPDIRILTDPWFSEGIYDGAWYQFPRIADPLEAIREPDLIYVSHIHPDHYDPDFLRALFAKWGEKPVLIPDFAKNHLEVKARFDGIAVTPIREKRFGDTALHIVPNIIPTDTDIDSALLVAAEGQSVLNLNDCIWHEPHVRELQSLIRTYTEELDLLALGYTGAGPFPQTYFDPETERAELEAAAAAKKEQFFTRYRRYAEAFPAKHRLPFAGKYILGGRLAPLNPYRGVADAVEVTAFDDKAIVLADAGAGEIDLATGAVTGERAELYPQAVLETAVTRIADRPLDYETEFALAYEKINFGRLLRAAYARAHKRSDLGEDYWFVVNVCREGEPQAAFRMNANRAAPDFAAVAPGSSTEEPRSELFVDYRYLYGLLSAVYHWNNAEIGSLYTTRRFPRDAYSREAQGFLIFLAAC